MDILFVLILVFALFHFVYESTIAPMIRLELRYKLFRLRDDIRSYAIDQVEPDNTKAIELLDKSICAVIARLSMIDLENSVVAQLESDKNPKFRDAVERRKNYLQNSESKKIREINAKLLHYSALALVCNSGGWSYLAIPFYMITALFSLVSNSLKRLRAEITKLATNIAFARDGDIKHFPGATI